MEVKGNFIVHGSYIDIHDNEVVNLSVDKAKVMVNGKEVNTTDTADDNQPATRKGGRTAEYLFCDDEKQKDEALSLKMAKVFVASLDEELLATPINSSKKNSINRAPCQPPIKIHRHSRWIFIYEMGGVDYEVKDFLL